MGKYNLFDLQSNTVKYENRLNINQDLTTNLIIKKNSKKIDYPVKIHFSNCKCSYYQKKSINNNNIIVAPYRLDEFKKRYFIYNSINDLEKDIDYFEDNCLCTSSSLLMWPSGTLIGTYNNNIYNGGVILISKYGLHNLEINDSKEMTNFTFLKIDTIFNLNDNSSLIQEFYKQIQNNFKELLDWYVLIGNTRNTKLFSFPKGKIKYGETIDMCCYREFEEETNYKIPDNIISSKNQLIKRENDNIIIPLEILINNFILKIIII